MFKKRTIEKFRSHGKLMLSGEYLVLKGASALAIPVKFGQDLEISVKVGTPKLSWNTYMLGEPWFEANFSIPDMAVANTNDFPIAMNIRDLILAARTLNPNFLISPKEYRIQSILDFNISWGLGSSSSLLVNIANWAKVDPFKLHHLVYKGSGYDVAVSYLNKPVIYNLKEDNNPDFMEVSFQPSFSDYIYFVYLGRKRDSNEAVHEFQQNGKAYTSEVSRISVISDELLKVKDYQGFAELMEEHELIISSVLGKPAVKKIRFSDFEGGVKSLGAWGGDFVMLLTEKSEEYVASYLKRKDLKVWFPYKKIILQ